MNPHTGEVVSLKPAENLRDGFVWVESHVARAQLEGQRVLATKALRRMRKLERQNKRRGRNI